MTVAAKFPAALAALVDFFAEHPSQPGNELILNTTINSTDLSIVATTNIPASWPATGRLIIDGEVIEYASYAAATFTIANTGKRGLETSFGAAAAGSHTAGAIIGNWVTAQAFAQVLAEIIAVETEITRTLQPNLVQNSDFGRLNVWGTYMPERFGDTSGWTSSSALSVSTNQLTIVTAARLAIGAMGNWVWRDGRWSAQFKAVNAGGAFQLFKYVDANDALNTGNGVFVVCDGTNFQLRKIIGGTLTTVATVAQTLTLNNFYWLELEAQGTTYVARFYSSGAAAAAKSAATLTQTLTGTISDAGVTSGGIALRSDQANSIWGGLNTGDGGVYVEGWCPESIGAPTHGGTIGGQAFGIDFAADSGPLTKQWQPRWFIPAATRTITHTFDTPDGSVENSAVYNASAYIKVSGLGGSGVLARVIFQRSNSANASQGTTNLDDTGNTSFARKTTGAITTEAGTRRARITISINPSSTATGTAYINLIQLEHGGVATTWRNAASDDAPIVWRLYKTSLLGAAAPTTTGSAVTNAAADIDAVYLAGNLFLPWDATVDVKAHENGTMNVTTSGVTLAILMDGAIFGSSVTPSSRTFKPSSTLSISSHAFATAPVGAGKHRFLLNWGLMSGGTNTLALNPDPYLIVTAYRGKAS